MAFNTNTPIRVLHNGLLYEKQFSPANLRLIPDGTPAHVWVSLTTPPESRNNDYLLSSDEDLVEFAEFLEMKEQFGKDVILEQVVRSNRNQYEAAKGFYIVKFNTNVINYKAADKEALRVLGKIFTGIDEKQYMIYSGLVYVVPK